MNTLRQHGATGGRVKILRTDNPYEVIQTEALYRHATLTSCSAYTFNKETCRLEIRISICGKALSMRSLELLPQMTAAKREDFTERIKRFFPYQHPSNPIPYDTRNFHTNSNAELL